MPDENAAGDQESAVNPLVVLDMARNLAKDVLALADYAPPEWDGGDPGYLFAGMCGLAEDLLAAIPEGGLRV